METEDSGRQSGGKSLNGLKKIENFSTFFKSFQLLPPDCLPESPVSIDSESVIQIKIGPLLVGVFRC